MAASLGLKSYLYLEKRSDDLVQLILPDVNTNKSWKLEDFPLRQHEFPDSDTRHPDNMPEKLKTRLTELKGETTADSQNSAIMAFLYLLVILEAKAKTPLSSGFTICVRSFLPVSAGLGSSASYAVAITTALLILTDLIPVDFNSRPNKTEYLDIINSYAFKAEEVIHGNPSGVDNAVATFGGAKSFVRGEGFATLEGFKSIRLLLTNTKVPRSTMALVAGVGDKRKKYPEVMNPILDAMHNIAIRCKDAFKQLQEGKISNDELMNEIEDMVDLNHCLLDAIGVSHPSLEKVRSITAQAGLKTKLTGAGGGGCAVTFIRDEVPQNVIDDVMVHLKNEGYDCYETSVGGIGADATALTKDENDIWLLTADNTALDQYFSK